MRRLGGGRRAAGRHDLDWDGRDERGVRVAAGIYFLKLGAAGSEVTAKIAVVP